MSTAPPQTARSSVQRFLDAVEWAGNRLPDPALLFVWALVITWGASWYLSTVQFTEIDPRTMTVDAQGKMGTPKPIQVVNQLEGKALTSFLSKIVKTFVEFPPLGVVLVALLGVGVAEHTGLINALIKSLLSITPRALLTPMLLFVAILSHSAGDTGYVLVIPLGAIIFPRRGATRCWGSSRRSPGFPAASVPVFCRHHWTRCCRGSRNRRLRSLIRHARSIRCAITISPVLQL